MNMLKKCINCGEEKILESFHKRSDSKDGRRNDCKNCHLGKKLLSEDNIHKKKR